MTARPGHVAPEYKPLPDEAQNLLERTELLVKHYRQFANNCIRSDDVFHAAQVSGFIGTLAAVEMLVRTITGSLKGLRPEESLHGIRQHEEGQTVAGKQLPLLRQSSKGRNSSSRSKRQ